jgi:hypothetical protein
MPSVQTVEHDVCSFGIFSILTMQTRQEPSMLMPGDSSSTALRCRSRWRPAGRLALLDGDLPPSIVSVTVSI